MVQKRGRSLSPMKKISKRRRRSAPLPQVVSCSKIIAKYYTQVSQRDAHEFNILQGINISSAEISLWKLHYTPICGLRNQISSERISHIVSKEVVDFIDYSSSYYQNLIEKVRPNSVNTILHKEGAEEEDMIEDNRIICRQLLLRLGDLARYKAIYGAHATKRSFIAAENYYRQASGLCPFNGIPHNQLAVLAVTENDQVRAIYHYLRSIFVKTPSENSLLNLQSIFRKNELDFSTIKEVISWGHFENIGREQCSEVADVHSSRQREIFMSHFVAYSNILFNKSGLRHLKKILYVTLEDLYKLPHSDPINQRQLGIQIITCIISSFRATSEVLKARVLQYFIMAAFKFIYVLISLTISDIDRSFLAAVVTFWVWFASRSDIMKTTRETEELRNVLVESLQHSEKLFQLCVCSSPDYQLLSTVENGSSCTLWEDKELRGFTLIDSFLSLLNFNNSSSDRQQTFIRLRRFEKALSSIKSELSTSTECFNSPDTVDTPPKRRLLVQEIHAQYKNNSSSHSKNKEISSRISKMISKDEEVLDAYTHVKPLFEEWRLISYESGFHNIQNPFIKNPFIIC